MGKSWPIFHHFLSYHKKQKNLVQHYLVLRCIWNSSCLLLTCFKRSFLKTSDSGVFTPLLGEFAHVQMGILGCRFCFCSFIFLLRLFTFLPLDGCSELQCLHPLSEYRGTDNLKTVKELFSFQWMGFGLVALFVCFRFELKDGQG